jgi:class 3 adenylate cyclase
VTRVELTVIVVTDLVGSTALASRLGGERFDELRREHDAILRDACDDFGGRVVKSTGDGFLTAFPSVAGGLDAAVRIQQKLERRNRSAEIALVARIGISVGDAWVEDGDYFGVPPIEATRLCAEAPGGEILVGEPVRTVLRDRSRHEFEDAGRLELRGLPEPVTAWRVLWTPLPDAAGPPLPPRLRDVPETAYVGRSTERSVLREAWDRAVDGRRQVVIISGEPGIGKTRLVTQAAQMATPDHALILYGRCDEDQGIPYYPWREVLRDYAEVAPRRLLRPYASELCRLVPGLDRKITAVAPPASADPEAERHRLFTAVRSLFAATAELAPVLIILDDLHWADRPTLLLLKHLVDSSTRGRLMILATYRDSDLAPGDPPAAFLAELLGEPGVERMPLVGLDEADIVELIEELAGHPIDARGLALAGDVHRDTAGNPFFVGELLRHLRETGAIAERPDGRWSFRGSPAGRGLPQSVREVIERRVQRLSAEARRVLTVAAVIGAEFDVALVARAADLTTARTLDLLEEAIAASLLTRTAITRESLVDIGLTEVYTFSHGLVQRTLYDAVPRGRRAALHRVVAETIEASCGSAVDLRLDELAHHYLAAVPAGEPGQAITYARRAGERAMRHFSYDQAAMLFERALAVPGAEDPRARIELLQALGDALMRAGDAEAARRALFEAAESARRQDEPEALARAVRACGIWGLSLGVDEVLVRLAEESIERLEGWGSRRLSAELKGLLAAALYYAPIAQADRRDRLAEEALAGARAEHARAGDRRSLETLAYVIGRYLLARWGPESATRDFALADELLVLCGELGDIELEVLARNWRTSALLELGDFAAVEREVARVEHMATALRQPRAMVFLPLHRGILAMKAGRFAEAERLNAESVEIGRRLHGSISLLAAQSQMMLIRLQQGRLVEIEAQVRSMVDAYPAIVTTRAALVALLLQAGRASEARAEFEDLVGQGLGGIPRNNAYVLTLALLAEAAAELVDPARARAIYDLLRPYAGRWVVSVSTCALWPVERSLGRLAGATSSTELALTHLRAARAAAEQAEALPSLALIAADEARLLAGRGAPGDAQLAAQRAAVSRLLAETLGMRPLEAEGERLEAELALGPDSGAVGTLEYEQP